MRSPLHLASASLVWHRLFPLIGKSLTLTHVYATLTNHIHDTRNVWFVMPFIGTYRTHTYQNQASWHGEEVFVGLSLHRVVAGIHAGGKGSLERIQALGVREL
jgi:hypothetical protein